MTIAEKLTSIKSSKESIKKAIQAKGVSCGDKLSDYPARIQAIPTAKLQTKNFNITENGSVTITPDSGNDGISGGTITANVVTPSEEKTVSITKNGTSTVTPTSGKLISKVTVTANVTTPSQNKSVTITTNGTTSVTPDSGYKLDKVDVTVNVPSSGGSDKFSVVDGMKFRGDWKNTSVANMDFSNVTTAESMFQECSFDGTSAIEVNMTKCTNTRMMFYQSTHHEAAGTIKVNVPLISGEDDTASTNRLSHMFTYCAIPKIEVNLDYKSGVQRTYLSDTFSGCTTQSIAFSTNTSYTLILLEGDSAGSKNNPFAGCGNLVSLTASSGVYYQGYLDLSDCTKLSQDSIYNIIEHLSGGGGRIKFASNITLLDDMIADIQNKDWDIIS